MTLSNKTPMEPLENQGIFHDINIIFSIAAAVCCAVYFCHIIYSKHMKIKPLNSDLTSNNQTLNKDKTSLLSPSPNKTISSSEELTVLLSNAEREIVNEC